MRLFVFPRLLLLPSKSQRSLLTGELSGDHRKHRGKCENSGFSPALQKDQFSLKISPRNEKTDQKTGRRRILKMVQVRRSWTNFSPPSENANFPTLSRWGCPSSRKILWEIRKNSHDLIIWCVYRKNVLKRIRTCDLYSDFACVKELLQNQ